MTRRTRVATMPARVEEAQVFAVPEPEFTDTWHPVSHRKVALAVQEAVVSTGMEITAKDYTLAQNGANLFASYKLSKGTNGISWMVGFRNSLCKRFPVGMVAGTTVMVCSNLMFSGKFLEFHKHTASMDEALLNELATNAMNKLVNYLTVLGEWQEDLKELVVDSGDFKKISFDLLYQGAIPPSKFMTEYLPNYDEEKKLNGESLYSVHGAVTRTLRGGSLFNISDRTAPLNKVIDVYAKQYKEAA